jgi:manganese-dependent inorganic pyrophosphatase
MEPTYVFGHKNPDTDTICSAIAYAYLKNTQSEGHIPARLGELNRETRFVLDTFGVPEPVLLPHIHVRVQDVMTANVITTPPTSTVFEVGRLMREHNVHAIPIVDEDGRVRGAVTERMLARSYLKEMEIYREPTTLFRLDNIAATLNGAIILGDPAAQVRGSFFVGAMTPETMSRFIAPGDTIILGDREETQEVALEKGASCLVLTGGFQPSARIAEMARAKGTAVIVTPHDSYAAASLIHLSLSALYVMERDVLTVSADSLVKEVTRDLLESKLDLALVVDDDGYLEGIMTKSDVLARRRRRAILVDHSEQSQSVDGIREAEILEILDHHRLGGLETAGPILAMIAPVGCTSTLVLQRYRELGVTPPRAMAGLMLAAILSDTMLLKSPTKTPTDEAAVAHLGRLLDEDPLEFGIRMYNAKFDIASLTPLEIATNDMKLFAFGAHDVTVSQLEVADKETVLALKDEILAAMAQYQAQHDLALMLLMVTDIMAEGTELLAVGQVRAVERAFGKPLEEQSVYLPGVMSRKKQVIPPLSGVF